MSAMAVASNSPNFMHGSNLRKCTQGHPVPLFIRMNIACLVRITSAIEHCRNNSCSSEVRGCPSISVIRMTKRCTVIRSVKAYLGETSPLIAEIETQNRVHPAFRPGMYDRFCHWLVTFHGEALEVVALRAAVVGISTLSLSRAAWSPSWDKVVRRLKTA